MATYSWATAVSGNWATATGWTPATVPNDPTAAVVIDAPAAAPYAVTISAGNVWTVGSLSMNAVNNLAGTNSSPYKGSELIINGGLAFGAGSPGNLSGSLQTNIQINNGTIYNPGTIDAFIQGEGNVLLTGTNGLYVTNWLQAIAGVTTIDTKAIAELSGNTLFDGIFQSFGAGSAVNFGGPRQNLIVNIQTIEGPPLIPTGWTELLLNDNYSGMGEWNGAAYVPIESTLTQIGPRATLDILGARNYLTTNALTLTNHGMLNLEAGVVTTSGININAGGVVQGSGTVASPVVNNSELIALGGTLNVTGAVTGVGLIQFDLDQKPGTIAPTGSTLELNAVGPSQGVFMNGDDTLVLNNLIGFQGTVTAHNGDAIGITGGFKADSATLVGNTLVLKSGATQVGTIAMAGTYTGDTFVTQSVATGVVIGVESQNNFQITDSTLNTTATLPGSPYTGAIPGVRHQFVDLNPDNLNIKATAPNSFIQTGAGNAVIDVSTANGRNILQAGGLYNVLNGGAGTDAFWIGGSAARSVTSVINNFHAGDVISMFGITQANSTFSAVNGTNLAGQAGVAVSFSTGGKLISEAFITGYTVANLAPGSSLAGTYDPSGSFLIRGVAPATA